jgi:hypothetical protein
MKTNYYLVYRCFVCKYIIYSALFYRFFVLSSLSFSLFFSLYIIYGCILLLVLVFITCLVLAHQNTIHSSGENFLNGHLIPHSFFLLLENLAFNFIKLFSKLVKLKNILASKLSGFAGGLKTWIARFFLNFHLFMTLNYVGNRKGR